MTTPNNLSAASANSLASTQDFFNNLLLAPINVSQNIDDAVIAFFEQVTENKESARAIASAVILTSVSQGIDPMETMREFYNLGPSQINGYLTMFLNLNRKGTSYLGLSNQPQATKFVARMLRP